MSRFVAPGALPDRAKQLPYNGLPHGHDAQGYAKNPMITVT